MRPGSLSLIVAALAAMLVFALVLRDVVQAARSPSAYAAPRGPEPAGRTYQNGNTNDSAEDGDNNQDANTTEDADNADADNEDRDTQDNDNEDDSGIDPGLPPSASSIRQPEPICSTRGSTPSSPRSTAR